MAQPIRIPKKRPNSTSDVTSQVQSASPSSTFSSWRKRILSSSGVPSNLDQLHEHVLVLMFANSDENKPVIISDDPRKFRLLIMAFNQYEKIKESSRSKALNTILHKHMPSCLSADLPMYLILLYKLVKTISLYKHEEHMTFISMCMEKCETIDPKTVAATTNRFIERGDFDVEFESEHSGAFSLLRDACMKLLSLQLSSEDFQGQLLRTYQRRVHVYSRIMWGSLALKFKSDSQQPSSSFWKENLLHCCSEVTLDPRVVNEVDKGLCLGSQLKLPTNQALNHHHLASFVIDAKSMRSLAAVEYYLQTIEVHFKEASHLRQFLNSLRKKYSCWLENANLTTVVNTSVEGTFCGVISESINCVNCIYEVCLKHDFEPSIAESECTEWLMMFIQTVDFSDALAKIHIKQFLGSEPAILQMEHCHGAIVKYICDGTLRCLPSMTVEKFGSLFSTLGVYSTSIVEEFLKKFKFPPNIRINDPTWIIFLNKIVSKCKGARNQSFLITHFFGPASNVYAEGVEITFLTDLLEVLHKVSGLLAIDEGVGNPESEEDRQNNMAVCLEFKNFLSGIIDLDQLLHVISTESPVLLAHSPVTSEKNDCEQHLFDVLCEYIMICKTEVFRTILQQATTYLCEEMGWMQTASIKQRFCLKCIHASCSRMKVPTSDRISWVQSHFNLIMDLGHIYYCYCRMYKLTDRDSGFITHNGKKRLMMDLHNCCNGDVKSYFEWVLEVQNVLKEINDKFRYQEITCYALISIEDNTHFEQLSHQMCACTSVTDSNFISKMKQKCAALFTVLDKILLKIVPGNSQSNFFTLEELLNKYQVDVPHDLQDMISRYTTYPSQLEKEWSNAQDLAQPAGEHRHPSIPSIKLSHKVTVYELSMLMGKLKDFHDPIAEFAPMLTFFNFHGSELFHKCLHLHKVKSTEALPAQCTHNVTQSGVAVRLSMTNFVQILKNTHTLICKFLSGKATYFDIVQVDPAKLDVGKELEILEKYSHIFGLNCSGLFSTHNLLYLYKIVCQVDDLIFVCNQFDLKNCLRDSRVCELHSIVSRLQDRDSISKITSSEAAKEVEHMKELLCFADKKDLQSLEVISAVRKCFSDILFQIFKDDRNRSHHEDVIDHLQHEVSVLKDFVSTVQLISPFFDTEQDFESLMLQLFRKRDITHASQMLERMDSNASVLVEIFLKESHTLLREEKQRAAQAVEENKRLHERNAWCESQLKAFAEEREKLKQIVDRLEKENKVLQRKTKDEQEENKKFQDSYCELKLEQEQLKTDNQSQQDKIQELMQDMDSLQAVTHTLKKDNESLHQQVSSFQSENEHLCRAQQESAAFGIEPWKVSRDQIHKQSEIIGGGGWGAVSRGTLQVAVKQFYPDILSPRNLLRIKREMEMLARVRHPNLVQFIGVLFDEQDDLSRNPPYIITELLDTSLRAAYEHNQIPQGNLCSIFEDTARALDYLHRRHEPIIHRDVSSANVLLKRLPNRHWLAKVSDLGSANLAKEAFTKNEGAIVYCAPEAFSDQSDTAHSEMSLTPKVDVYSYGIMLCELATSTFPAKNVFPSLLERILNEWPRLHHLTVICISREPERRPSMEKVLSALKGLS